MNRFAAIHNHPKKALLKYYRERAYTLIELLITIALIGVLSALALSSYMSYVDSAKVAVAQADIKVISDMIAIYYQVNDAYPTSLAVVGGQLTDPWGKAYIYTDLTTIRGHGAARKDRKMNPLNSDFDLYSLGKDGVSKPQITNKDSVDDVIRASNGTFIDLASKF